MLIIIIATAFLSTSCSKDDKKDTPQPVQQEDPMAYMTVDFLEANIVGVWVSDSAFNTSSTGYYNEAHVDTMWFTTTEVSFDNINYWSYIFDIHKSVLTGATHSIGTVEYMDKAGTQMYFKVPYPYTTPGFDKTVIRYFKQ